MRDWKLFKHRKVVPGSVQPKRMPTPDSAHTRSCDPEPALDWVRWSWCVRTCFEVAGLGAG